MEAQRELPPDSHRRQIRQQCFTSSLPHISGSSSLVIADTFFVLHLAVSTASALISRTARPLHDLVKYSTPCFSVRLYSTNRINLTRSATRSSPTVERRVDQSVLQQSATSARQLRLSKLPFRFHSERPTTMATTTLASLRNINPPNLPKSDGKPDAKYMTALQRGLFSFAETISTTNGGGAHGHLGAIMPAAAYLLLPNTAPYVNPVHPGNGPVFQANATNGAISQAQRQYDNDLSAHALHHAADNLFKQAIIETVDSVWYLELEDPIRGLADVTSAQLLAYLVATYGQLTATEIADNRRSLRDKYNPDEPLATLWKRIVDVQYFATLGNDPIPELIIVSELCHTLEATGVFNDAISWWNRNLPNPVTVAAFKTYMDGVDKERRRALTARGAGYHGANMANQETNTDPANAAEAPTDPAEKYSLKIYYCHSHGFGRNAKHTSATCTRRKDGHKEKATVLNTMGGCMDIKFTRAPRPESS